MSDDPGTTTTTGARNERPRDGRGKFAPTLETAERDSKACRMVEQGYRYDEIAKELGFSDRGAAHRAVERALILTRQEAADDVRKIHLARLQEMYRTAREIMLKNHIAVQNGKVVYLDAIDGTRTPVADDLPKLAAIDRMLRVLEREAKLLGLDAAKQVEIITLDAVQAEIREIEARMAARESAERHGEQVPA